MKNNDLLTKKQYLSLNKNINKSNANKSQNIYLNQTLNNNLLNSDVCDIGSSTSLLQSVNIKKQNAATTFQPQNLRSLSTQLTLVRNQFEPRILLNK